MHPLVRARAQPDGFALAGVSETCFKALDRIG
jgi:hypothetical protein